jgi:WD40 repeat protein/transcriptional regulator with XRE-family HTH domain
MSTSIPASTLEKFTTFGDLLRFLRRRMDITQTELSIAVGYSTAQISRLEQNLRLPDVPTIQARFIPALDLGEEVAAVERLLDLAANVRREDAPISGLCPFKGLNYFDEADADWFVGREALTAKLTELVLSLSARGKRFLAVVGASGSGKSSLVRAGLVSSLRWNKISTDWQIHILTPTGHPLESLAKSLAPEFDSAETIAAFMNDLAGNARSLHLFAKHKPGSNKDSCILIVVDQFEELFALCRSEEERISFIDNLLTASSELHGPTVVVITLRADFYAHCADYPQLREALAQHQEYIGAMTHDELSRVIEEPARRGRWEIEPGLVDLLLHDVGHEPGALPLLSHALLETWQRRRGRTMTMSGYASSGGVRGAIAETAEAVFTDQFTSAQKSIARRIFLRLTELGDQSVTGDTRRRVTFNELILKPEETTATQTVLKTLADARLITTTEDSAEVAHEALIREWPTLRKWLEEDRESLRLHRQLTETAQEWLASNREADLLYRGARLMQVREWSASNADEMNPLEREFLTTSMELTEREIAKREEQRQRELEAARKLAETEKARAEEQIQSANQLRIRNRLLTTVVVAALVLAAVAGMFSLKSSQNAAIAEANYVRAESLRLASQANLVFLESGGAQTAALLSIRALQSGYSAEADATLIRSLSGLYNRKLFRGHAGVIVALAFSPDGKYVLTAGADRTPRLWNIQTGQEIRRYIVHRGAVRTVAISPDGKFVLTGGDEKIARLWDAKTGRQLHVFSDHGSSVTSVAFSPDGKYILTVARSTSMHLWNANTGQKIRDFSADTESASFSPDGRYILTHRGLSSSIWEVATGKEFRRFPVLETIVSEVFSPDGRYVLTGHLDGTASLLEIETGKEIYKYIGNTGTVWTVAMSPDGKYVLTGTDEKTVILWDTQTGKEVHRFLGHEAAINIAVFSPDGRYILTGSDDKTARLWATPPIYPPFTFLGHTKGITSIAYSPDGKYALTGSNDNTARLWDVESNYELRAFVGHTASVTSVAFSPDGKYVLTSSDDKTARLWDAETGKELRVFADYVSSVTSVAFSHDGKYILTTGLGRVSGIRGETRLWDITTGKKIRIFEEGPGRSKTIGSMLAFSSDDKNALIRGFDGDAYLFDITTGKELGKFGHSEPVNSVAFAPDSKFILTGSNDRTARLWDAETGMEIRIFTDQTSAVLSVAFSFDGKYILTGHRDAKARLWDITSGQIIRTFTGHTNIVTSGVFSPDGKYVFTGSEDGTARLWHTDYRTTIRFVCSMLWEDLTEEERKQYSISDNLPTCPDS